MIEFVAFDADGVLFESDRSNIAYYNAIYARVGEPPLSRDEQLAAVSSAAAEMFRRVARARWAATATRRRLPRSKGGRSVLGEFPDREHRPGAGVKSCFGN